MRTTIAVLLFAATGSLAEAAERRWCSISNEGSSSCTYASVDQCRASVAGTGGSCMPEAPVGHLQPRGTNTASGPAPRDEKLDALLERVNRKNDALILCRGC